MNTPRSFLGTISLICGILSFLDAFLVGILIATGNQEAGIICVIFFIPLLTIAAAFDGK